jgi:hypothetical protein
MRKTTRTSVAMAAMLAVSLAAPTDVSASGHNSCSSGDGCIARDPAGGGDFYGWAASNVSSYAGRVWANGNAMDNTASSVRNRNSTYISFCVYQGTSQTGGVAMHGKWSVNGWSNAVVDNSGSSHYFRVQSTC